MKNKTYNDSFKNAFIGIFSSIKAEKNMKAHIFITILVVIAGFILKINMDEWIICILLFAFVISMELINTAIETIVDMITKEYDKQAKLAKDIAAGAVLVAALSSVIIGSIIFIPKILEVL